MIDTKMAQDLEKLGIQKDDCVLVHSSLSSLGYVEGGADTVIDTLLSCLPEGTLLMPALSYSTVRPETPVFSLLETPSCVGAISEAFRRRAGVLRSMHPSHSVCAMGKYAHELLDRHIETDTPAGATSPFALLPKYNGKILMLGCGLRPNTSMHAVEEQFCPDYLLREGKFPFQLTDGEGNTIEKEYAFHYFKNTKQCYDRLANLMPIAHGYVKEAECYLIDTPTMWQVATQKMKEDLYYFVDRSEQ